MPSYALSWLIAVALGAGMGAQPTAVAFKGQPPEIRVVLSDKASAQTVSGSLAWSCDGKGALNSSDPVEVALLRTRSGEALLTATIGKKVLKGQRFSALPQSGYVQLGKKSYRGRLELFLGKSGGLVALNVLPLEDYLLSVVPSEMPAKWPGEALRAQAVAARTYAISQMMSKREQTYDVYSDTSDQMYRGVAGEAEASSRAVRDTAGQILTYEGTPIVAYYCSDCGGYTKTGKYPYLQCVPSSAPESPYNNWTVELSSAELAALAKQAGRDVGRVLNASAENEPLSGHLASLTLTGERGSVSITGAKLRGLIGIEKMRSTRAWIVAGNEAGSSGGASGAADGGAMPERYRPDLDSVEVQGAAPLAEAAALAAWDTVTLQGWARPFVAWAGGADALKLRTLYVYDGRSLLRGNRELHAVKGERTLAAPDKRTSPAMELPASLSVDCAAGLTLHGSGYGHGLGMSQWGARQLALEGSSYKKILLHFYSGVELVNWDGSLPSIAPAESLEQEDEQTQEFYRPFQWRR